MTVITNRLNKMWNSLNYVEYAWSGNGKFNNYNIVYIQLFTYCFQ